MIEILISGLVFGAVFTAFWVALRWQRANRLFSQQLNQMAGSHPSFRRGKGIPGNIKQSKKKSIFLPVAGKLEELDVPLNVREYLMFRFIVLTPGILLLARGMPVQGVLMVLLGLLIPELILKLRAKKRLLQIETQLGTALLSMANALRAGFSFLQTMELVCKDEKGPLAIEFRRALQEMNLGISVEEALRRLNRRVRSEDLELVVTAILIQRQVGGDLAGVLEQIHWTIQERNRLRKETQTLTAQGRLSGMIIGILPVILTVVIYIINPQYMSVLFTEEIGRLLLVAGLISELLGFWLIRRVVAIDF